MELWVGMLMTALKNCARCNGDHEIQWQWLTRPVEDSDGSLWEYWAPCPTNGQPILMRVTGK